MKLNLGCSYVYIRTTDRIYNTPYVKKNHEVRKFSSSKHKLIEYIDYIQQLGYPLSKCVELSKRVM